MSCLGREKKNVGLRELKVSIILNMAQIVK